MFWRRREEEEPASEAPQAEQPAPMTMPRPPREPAGIGLRARPSSLGARLRAVLVGTPLSDELWEELEEALIAADVGATTAIELVDSARRRARQQGAQTGDAVRDALADEIQARLDRVGCGSFEVGEPPAFILMVGVNGTGKTTTIAKLAARFRAEGREVLLAAADTFRAAAIEQLRIWGEEVGVPVIAQRAGADPGAVAFDAATAATSRGAEVVLVDTAGRLQNKSQLMAELAKIRRVIERQLPGQPAHVLLVVDATTGQNGLAQAEAFSREVGVTGIVLTKLDGTAKGGVVVAIADRLELPIVFAGIGEEIDAMAPFDSAAFVDWLLAG